MIQRDTVDDPPASPSTVRHTLSELEESLGLAIRGKAEVLRLAVVCALSRGHLLIEDVPGVGKTTLAQALARVVRSNFHRLQFTSDMLPSDVLGVTIYNNQTQAFEFKPGPIFTNFLLADEINRATPKTQSALLEAMNERQITIDGRSWPLEQPFMVIATQNPVEHHGTYPLPESQLDRFLMRIRLGYPDATHERELLREGERRELLPQLAPVLDAEHVLALQAAVRAIHASDALLDYLQALIAQTRAHADIRIGLSPRAGQGLLRAAQAWAAIAGRHAVLPDDVQAVFGAVAGHRLARSDALDAADGWRLAARVVQAVPVPT